MGLFSWNTSDSQRSIANIHSSRSTFPVLMIDDKGNSYLEENYAGYGIFGGKDFFELTAEMNGLGSDREKGIDLIYKNNPSGSGKVARKQGIKTPVLVEPSQIQHYIDDGLNVWNLVQPCEPCEFQGFFYSDDDEAVDY